jgi:hypothetical protein
MRSVHSALTALGALCLLCALLYAGALSAQAVPAAGDELPSADSIIERFVEASGGEKAIRSIEAMHVQGSMEIPGLGQPSQVELFASEGKQMLMVMTLPGLGEMRTGLAGGVAWLDSPMTGPMLLEGEQLEDVVRQADLQAELHYDDLYESVETVEKTEFAGEAVYKVKLVEKDGKETFEYFSVESGLKVGTEGEESDPMSGGKVFVVTELRDYREVEGRKMPMTTVSKAMGQEMVMRFDEVSFGAVESAVFELPEGIKTLVEMAKE